MSNKVKHVLVKTRVSHDITYVMPVPEGSTVEEEFYNRDTMVGIRNSATGEYIREVTELTTEDLIQLKAQADKGREAGDMDWSSGDKIQKFIDTGTTLVD